MNFALACGFGVGLLVVASGSRPLASPAQDGAIIGSRYIQTAQPGDTLTSVGARAGADVRGLARINGLAANAKLDVGRPLVVDARHVVPQWLDGRTADRFLALPDDAKLHLGARGAFELPPGMLATFRARKGQMLVELRDTSSRAGLPLGVTRFDGAKAL